MFGLLTTGGGHESWCNLEAGTNVVLQSGPGLEFQVMKDAQGRTR